MKCSILTCPGEYDEKFIAKPVHHKGKLALIDNVPAEVCSFCGDTLFKLETIRRLENIKSNPLKTKDSVPLYKFG